MTQSSAQHDIQTSKAESGKLTSLAVRLLKQETERSEASGVAQRQAG